MRFGNKNKGEGEREEEGEGKQGGGRKRGGRGRKTRKENGREREGKEGEREGEREKEEGKEVHIKTETYSLVQSGASLCELDRMNVAPGALHTEHLAVDQSDQVLTHLTLRDTTKHVVTPPILFNTSVTFVTSLPPTLSLSKAASFFIILSSSCNTYIPNTQSIHGTCENSLTSE